MKTKNVRRALTVGAVLALAGTATAAADAAVQDPVADRQGSLVSFGPLMDNGFPASYKDSNGIQLEPCMTADDPLCSAGAGDTYDPELPLSFPDNFPEEFFYQLASANVPVNGNGDLLVEMNLEGAFAAELPNPGDQLVFGRIRIRDKAVPEGTTWRITHPYGVDVLTAEAKKGISATVDIGVAPGLFSGALAGRVGPFLQWDPSVVPAAPAGYTGDPAVPHAVVGSPYGTNFVKVEQQNDDGTWTELGQWDDQFSVQGRYAVNSGVDVDAAYFTGDDKRGFLDVYASSDAAQSIVVRANAALGTPDTPMREVGGHYYARIAVDTKIPAGTEIEVANTSDVPEAVKKVTITDQVTVTSATYDADSGDLTVQATSSDMESGADEPALSVAGFGPLDDNGEATFHTMAPPAALKVTSSAGGSDTETQIASGAGFEALAPVAQFVAPATVEAGQPVLLDGRASVGGRSYDWTTDNGTVVPDKISGLATWTPEKPSASATITLTVTGPGGESTASSTVTVIPEGLTTVNAGPDQVKTRGQVVKLAGTANGPVRWSQVSGPAVTLSNTSSLTPTFTYPKMARPVGPAGHSNPGYVAHNEPVVLQLAAVGGGWADEVTISPTAETITPGTARYRTRTGVWRVTGTTDLKAGQTIAMVLGPDASGRFIGQATVDAAGAFSFKGADQPVASGATVTYVSVMGGTVTGPLSITR